ncbi:Zeta-sarcoglycan [Liparis tanakae]|uniref:Zeta-sarcoglycan n=1 Tax=Liparis tanakae TaxID=230148 RepID=A0A4Z2HEU2_9TELE|nr:Zeta-sarcoglycan [Liparis tanakae]
MTQEQYILAAQPNPLHQRGASVCGAPVYPAVGIYGWRKRCLYFFILLLLVTMILLLRLKDFRFQLYESGTQELIGPSCEMTTSKWKYFNSGRKLCR